MGTQRSAVYVRDCMLPEKTVVNAVLNVLDFYVQTGQTEKPRLTCRCSGYGT